MSERYIDRLRSWARQTPDAPAILAPGRAPLTYQRLWAHVGEVGRALRSIGLGPGDRVAIVLPNGPEMATCFLAVSAYATSAPLNPAYRRSEFDFYLSDLSAKALIVSQGMDSPAVDAARERGIPVMELSPVENAEAGIFRFNLDSGSSSAYGESSDIALVLHTSGTTARPKIVPLTHANICASALNIVSSLGLAAEDRCLNVMPLFHVHGLIGALLSSLAAGASVVCTPGFRAGSFFGWVEQFTPTWYTAVPTMHEAILSLAPANAAAVKRNGLRFIRSCSSALPTGLTAALEDAFHVPVVEAYGMTEASHQMASNPLPPLDRKPGSVGIAAGIEIAIMDENGRLLPPGESAEIVIRGPSVTDGYECNPAANQAAFTDGWFRTGDRGYMDADGYVFIAGRIKEMINRGGEKISPREIDEALMEHPAVAQAIAFAVPHPTLGEDLAAAVVLRAGAVATEKEIRDFAAARLADFKAPRRVWIVGEIPKGPTGKPQRIGLAEKLGVAIAEYVEPAAPLERMLAGIWGDILRVDRVGVHDNFFDLGGDSITATQVVSRLRDALKVELDIATFFDRPTIAELCAVLEGLPK